MRSTPWFIDTFWKAGNPTYGSILQAVGITKEIAMMMKSTFYPDLNDLDFVVTLVAMKNRVGGDGEPAPMMGGSRRRKRKSKRKSKRRRRKRL